MERVALKLSISEHLFLIEVIMLPRRLLLVGLPLALTAACASYRSEQVGENSRAETATTASDASEVQASINTPAGEMTTNATEARIIKSGSFTAGEYATSGRAKIVSDSGQLVLELDQNFATSPMGPDLVVVLHQSKDVIGSTTPPAFPLQEGDYVVLAELQSFSGSQKYVIPASVNLDDYQSVAIWCRRFNATFGAAALQ